MEGEPEWIRDDVVRAIHVRQLAEHGGKEGVLSESALDASLANPKHFLFYTSPQPDLPAIAAMYAHSVANNHPFCDGNKRTAAVVCELFLLLNGLELRSTDEESYEWYIKLASSEIDAEQFAEWLRTHCTKAV